MVAQGFGLGRPALELMFLTAGPIGGDIYSHVSETCISRKISEIIFNNVFNLCILLHLRQCTRTLYSQLLFIAKC